MKTLAQSREQPTSEAQKLSAALHDLASAHLALADLCNNDSQECLVSGELMHPTFKGGWLVHEKADGKDFESVMAHPTHEGAIAQVFLKLALRGQLGIHVDRATGLNGLLGLAQSPDGHTFRLTGPDAFLTIAPNTFSKLAEIERQLGK